MADDRADRTKWLAEKLGIPDLDMLRESTAGMIGRLEDLRPQLPVYDLTAIEPRDPVDDQMRALNAAVGDRLDRMLNAQIELVTTLAGYVELFQETQKGNRRLAIVAIGVAIAGVLASIITAASIPR
jgi:hypothetical protein